MAKDWLKAHPGGVYDNEGAYDIEFDRKSEHSRRAASNRSSSWA